MLLGSFIGIIASIIRLIFSVLVNIIFMPRIDYSYLVEPLQWTGEFIDSRLMIYHYWDTKIILDVLWYFKNHKILLLDQKRTFLFKQIKFLLRISNLDSAHESFKSFLRLEMLCTYPLVLGKLIFMSNNY
jgi:hypothetical protein